MPKNEMIKEKSFPMPITYRAFQTAGQFAALVPNPQEAQQIYLNTLAVWAVHDYLQLMEIDTDLEHSDSWHPVLRMCVDVADLTVKGLGKLECRPIGANGQGMLENQEPSPSHPESFEQSTRAVCFIPPEVWDERIGYVVVEIDEEKKEATLLGFAKTAGTGELVLSELQSMDALLRYLDELARSHSTHHCLERSQINLSQWMLNIFEAGWQDVESLFGTQPETLAPESSSASRLSLGQWFQNIVDTSRQAIADHFGSQNNPRIQFQEALNFRHPEAVDFHKGKARNLLFPKADVTRAKLIDLRMQLKTKTIALLVALTQESDQKVNILVQLHPRQGEMYLPPHLKLVLLSESGETFQEVESRGQDLCIQLRPFKVLSGTNFSIQVALDGVSIKEAFAI